MFELHINLGYEKGVNNKTTICNGSRRENLIFLNKRKYIDYF